MLALSIAWAVVICCSLPAIGETPAPSYGQGQQTQQTNPEQQDPDYNGEDFTRPQRSFDTRFTYISSGTTSQTDRESWLLRGNWKTDLNNGWRLGLLAQVPVDNKTIFNSNGSVQDFGIGDTAFQAALRARKIFTVIIGVLLFWISFLRLLPLTVGRCRRLADGRKGAADDDRPRDGERKDRMRIAIL